jgi:hypothetical protein
MSVPTCVIMQRLGTHPTGQLMKRDEAIEKLRQHEAGLKQLGVQHLYLFGSTARGEAPGVNVRHGAFADLLPQGSAHCAPSAAGNKHRWRAKPNPSVADGGFSFGRPHPGPLSTQAVMASLGFTLAGYRSETLVVATVVA